ncbi:DUF2167 domain-containing protein [Cohnella silvisoli]|uniref:DUF2167 domain-containing protein n=1 Tax=Cohnella silvisoli TaxID=2873699 RepID=A0ABV1KYP1_9BACL|nr:DUF2167 domain-containing protein [Cohnella silvisoli]
MLRMRGVTAAFVLAIALSMPISVYAEGTETAEPRYDWVEGTGQSVQIGSVADLALDPAMLYLDADNTRRFLDENGNISSDSDIASVFPADSDWSVYFQYFEEGHVADDEKNDIDADALLQSYKDGTEEQNKKLEDPADHLFVEGWEKAPEYDETRRALTWTLRMHDGNNEPLVNQNVRVLTREGYMSVILVTDPAQLQADAAAMNELVLKKFTVKSGQRYEDFNESTDKKASYGLTGLILGGAGLLVAKKAGLIALIVVLAKKFGIVIVAAIAGLWRYLRGKSKKNDSEPTAIAHEQPVDPSSPTELNRS